MDTSSGTSILSKPDVLSGWIGAGAKVLGLLTAIFGFMLARGKFLEWFHGSRVAASTSIIPNPSSSLPVILVGSYALVYSCICFRGSLPTYPRRTAQWYYLCP